MDVKKLIEVLHKEAYGSDIEELLLEAATALSTLQAENESLKEKLYDEEGVNLVDYWMQQAKIEENGHRNCQAENEKLRAELEQKEKYYEQMVDALAATESAELEQVKAERDMAVEDFRRIGSEGLCSVCGNLNAPDLYCADCKGTAHIVTDMFEWRGQKED